MKTKLFVLPALFVLFATTFASADFRPGRVRPSMGCTAVDGQPFSAHLLATDGSPVEVLAVESVKNGATKTLESFPVLSQYNQTTQQHRFFDQATKGQALQLNMFPDRDGTYTSVLNMNSKSGRLRIKMRCQYYMLTM
jgi:hypothetical protein